MIGSLTNQIARASRRSLISHFPETDVFVNASPPPMTSTDQPSRKSTAYGTRASFHSRQVAARFTYGAQVVSSRSAGRAWCTRRTPSSSAARHPPKTGSGKLLSACLRSSVTHCWGRRERSSENARMSVSRSSRTSGSSTISTRGSTPSERVWSSPYSRSQARWQIVTTVTSQPCAQN
jgi:hypothetical protein